MPFTISHTAVVLPFARPLARWQLLSAAVIGSMVPDFGLFLPWRPERFETHSAMALLTFCLPVGLTCYWIFQYLIKTPVIELLPNAAYERWRPFAAPAPFLSVRQWLLAAVGVLMGAVTHLVLDGFTHEGARGVRLIPVLDDPVPEIHSHHVTFVRLLQDGISLIGLAAVLGIVCYALRGGRVQAPAPRPLRIPERWSWRLAYLATALAVGEASYLWMRHGSPHWHTLTAKINFSAIASLYGLAAALLGVSPFLKWRLRAGP
jgi:hypothetical protein